MDRILAMSLVGAGPCNVFGPGMSAGALESFARDAGRAKAEGNSRGGGAAAGGTRSASAGSGGGKRAAERTGEKEANSGASTNATRSCPALDFDERFCFDAVVAPY
ncbi:hypothetical protein BDA96_10G026600 [Sorghum bicolor]|uniref:Uncharacterized protein n=2 Tax=Sorghum bicolor TaxID=4558 RepID=A0A921PYB6_SORBI|nr:fibroin heavy chain [Sorghum bicolor]EER87787.1 hypothetical protein SORBI_3010G023000 [Sorghum bicolor]KAG0512579.1 hypothetical protein BDA96_10G026600 [Sorghum bicolor]|eukprot:XP_002436420.1 fibroin heavy chain [Sorghum bicolor]